MPNGRDRADRARQEAEALFAPKARALEPTAPVIRPNIRESAVALAAAPEAVQRRELPKAVAAAVDRAATAARVIPPDHATRIRTWLKYGMTLPEVAEVYGVEPNDIERVLAKS